MYVGAAYSAATLNVTVTNPAAAGFITAYPSGTVAPNASNVNFVRGQTVPNEVVVKVGADGYIDFANSSAGSTDLIVDTTGYFTTGSGLTFMSIVPTRYLDTRAWPTAPAGIGPNGDDDLLIKNQPVHGVTIPNSALAVAANITVTNPARSGHITVFPDNEGQPPNTSVVNFSPGQTIPNATTVGLGPLDGRGGVFLWNASTGSTDLVVDVFGYYA